MTDDAPPEQIEPGQVVAQGRFALLEVLGRGGLATVFRAHDTRSGSEVAIKILRDRYVGRPEREERLRREFEYATRVEHPAVIDVFEQGTLEDGRPFFSMELVDGQPLSRMLCGSGGLPYEQMRRVARAIAEALDAVHQAGIVHRDLKPANVLLLAEDRIKLIDFGMAGDDDAPVVPAGHSSRLTRANDLLGTHEYMAPEQVLKQPPRRAMDVFALGVVMYELLSSNTPYAGMGAREYVELQIGGDPLLRSAERWGRLREAPPGLARLIDDCRRRDPDQRPADMREVIRRLDTLDAGAKPTAVPMVFHNPRPVLAADEPVNPEVAVPAAIEPVRATVAITGEPTVEPEMAAAVREASAPTRAASQARSWRTLAWVALPVAAALVLWVSVLRSSPATPPTLSSSVAGLEVSDEPVVVASPDLAQDRVQASTMGAAPSPRPSRAQDSETELAPDAVVEANAEDDEPTATEDQPVDPPRERGGTGPKQRPKARTTGPSAEPAPSADACARTIAKAQAAFSSYRWPAVLAHTRDGSCWSEHQAEYLAMRTEALMEEGRWAECVRMGRRSSDPGVRRHAQRCQKRLATITGTP